MMAISIILYTGLMTKKK